MKTKPCEPCYDTLLLPLLRAPDLVPAVRTVEVLDARRERELPTAGPTLPADRAVVAAPERRPDRPEQSHEGE